jgi:hypothetical protein
MIKMKKFNSYIILFFSLLILNIGLSQKKNAGFYGKRFYVQADGLFSYPVMALFFNDGSYYYAAKGNNLVEGNYKFNYGFRLSAGYALKRNFGIGLDFGYDFCKAGINPDYYNKHEMFDISTMVFVPKIEFAHQNALLPMGISHHIGIGAEWSNIVDRDYLFSKYDPSTGFETTYNYKNVPVSELPFGEIKNIPSIKRYILMYDITMRNPISKNLFISYGFKYVLKFSGEDQESKLANSPNFEDYLNEINYIRNTNLITFHLGLTLAF